MSRKYPGLYLYYDWIDALAALPPGKAMAIIKNLRSYAQFGIEPPAMSGSAGCLQAVFLAQLNRSKINAENGKKGGAPTHKTPVATSLPPSNETPSAEGPPRGLQPDGFESFSDYMDYIKQRCDMIRQGKA